MGIIRDGFVVLRNWATAINKLPEEYQLACYKALTEYGLTGQRPKDMPPVVDAMIESFSVGMENAIERYNASVENGKKGGAPKGNQNARKHRDDENDKDENVIGKSEQPPEIEEEKQPKTTTIDFKNNQNNLNQPKTSKNNPNVNVNVKDKDISLLKNKIKNKITARVCTREEVFNDLHAVCKDLYSWYPSYKDDIDRVINGITDLICDTAEKGELRFYGKSYTADEVLSMFRSISDDKKTKLISSIVYNREDIKNIGLYAFGAILNEETKNDK